MTLQNSERLRQLVSDYYHGLTTLESYRQQRAQLLDNIGADIGEQSPEFSDERQPPPAAAPKTSAAAPKDPKPSKSASGAKKLVIGTIAVFGIAAIAYVAVTQMSDSGRVPNAEAERSGPGSEISLERGDALIDEFLSRNDWTDDSLGNFLLAWEALDESHRQLATEGRPYRRLTTLLHQRIREEAALSGPAESARLESLADFADTMGAPYRRSWAVESDQNAKPEVVTNVDAREEPQVDVTESDEPVTTATKKIDVAPVSVGPKAPTEQKSGKPADNVISDPIKETAAESSAGSASTAAVDDPCPAQIARTRRPYCQDELPDGSAGPPLVVLPTGTYQMGSGEIESESPPHQVDIAYHIAMSRYEITAQEYASFCVSTSLLCAEPPWDGDHPVVSVSWDDANSYADWLSESTGFTYRLPSEAEWEFAARAGTQSPYFFGDEITPSVARSSEYGAVDSPLPRSDRMINRNPFRLYHMSGNVREWTLDAWYPNYDNAPRDGSARRREAEASRVVRGGSYSDPGVDLRSAARAPLDRDHRDAMTGFRVVREVRVKPLKK